MKQMKKLLFTGFLAMMLFVVTACFSQSVVVSYNTNGGTPISEEVIKKGAIPEEVAPPVKTGYTFDGWFSDVDLTQEYTFVTAITSNTTLYARWEPAIFQVTWNSNGGSDIPTSNVTYQTTVQQPTTPTKPGYVFRGWFTNTNLTTQYEFSTLMPASNFTLYAKWLPGEFTIEFNSHGGSIVNDVIGFYNESFAMPSNPNRYGYTFDAWYLDELLTTPFTSNVIPNQNTELHAKWTPKQINVTFVIIEGNSTTSSVTFGEAISEPTNPTRTGYTFNEWQKDGVAYNFSTLVNSESAITLRATWTANPYTISFEENGGSTVNNITAPYFSPVNKPANPTKTGHTFSGWYSDAELTQSYTFTQMPLNGINLFAKWTLNQYTLTFNSGEGSIVSPITAYYNSEITAPNNPTLNGYTFGGWYSDSNYQTVYTIPTTMPAGSRTLYARWILVNYTITYITDNGSTSSPTSYSIESPTFALLSASKAGYSFTRWENALGETITQIEAGSTGDMTLTAIYTPINYTITYMTNGGTSSNPATYTIETPTITLSEATKTGYTFARWEDALNQTVTQIEIGSIGNRTFTAVYTPITYSITYILNDGDATNPSSYTIETTTFALNSPTKEGFTFLRWENGSGQIVSQISKGTYGDIELTAIFGINSHIIYYYIDDVLYDEVSYDYNDVVTPLADATKDGYSFDGWSTHPTTMPNNDVRIDGSFSVETYSITYHLLGGQATNPTSYTIETVTFDLNDASKDYYTFARWEDSQKNAISQILLGSFGDLDLYAIYIPIEYSISYVMDGGTTASPTSYTIESDTFSLLGASRTGYTFVRWENALGETITRIEAGSTGDMTLTAIYTPINYTITYNLDNGSATNPTSYTIETPTITFNDASKEGYTFGGWYASSDFSGSAITQITLGSTGNRTLYAKFNLVSYTISYYDGENVIDSPSLDYTYNVESGMITLINHQKTGYTFLGWYDNASFSGSQISSISANSTGNMTFYAKYQVNTYNVVFYGDSGEVIAIIKDVAYGTQIDLAAALEGNPADLNRLIELNSMLIQYTLGAIDGNTFMTYFIGAASNLALISPEMAQVVQQVEGDPSPTNFETLMNQSSQEISVLAQALDVKIALLTKLRNDMENVILQMGTPSFTESATELFIYVKSAQGAYTSYSSELATQVNTWLTSSGSDNNALIGMFSLAITELEEASRAKVSLSGNYPIKDGYSFVGWRLGSETKYLGWTEYQFAGTIAYAPASLGTDPAKLVALYVRISEIIGTFNDLTNMFSWSPIAQETLDSLYDSQNESIAVEYEVYIKDIDGHISLLTTTSATSISLSYIGTYTVIVVPVIDIIRSNIVVNTIKADVSTSSGRTISVIRSEGNATIEADGQYYYKINLGNNNYIFYFFSNTEINFTSADFTILTGNEYVSVENQSKLVFGSEYTTANQVVEFTFTSVDDGPTHVGRIYPYISQFELGESLTSYLQLQSEMNDSLFMDKTMDPYSVGKSYLSIPSSAYYQFNEGNGFYLPLMVKTTGGTSLNLPSGMFEYKAFKDEVEVTISTTDINAEIYRADHYLYFRDVGSTYTIEVMIKNVFVPQALSSIITAKQFVVQINDGANIYTNEDLKEAFSDTQIHSINLHNRIEAQLTSEQMYTDPDDGQTYPYNFYQGSLLNIYNQSPALAEKSGNVYQRIIPASFENPDSLVIHGNYFTIDGSNLPFTNYAPGGITLGGEPQASNLGTVAGYEIRSVHVGIFSYMSIDGSGTYHQNTPYGNVTFSNMTVLGNTQTPTINYGDNQSQIEAAIALMGRNSGGYIGLQNFYNTALITDNVVVGNTTLAIKTAEATTAILDKLTAYNSWANGIYAYSAENIAITNAHIEASGGAAIHLEDTRYSKVFAQTAVIDSSTVTVENWVSGEESWFKAYGMELAAMMMKSQMNEGVKAIGSRILRSMSDPSTGLVSRKMNLLALVMPVGEQLDPGESLISATDFDNRTTPGYTDMTITIVSSAHLYPYDSAYGETQYAVLLSEFLYPKTSQTALPIGDFNYINLPSGTSDLGVDVLESMLGVSVDFSNVGRGHLIAIVGLDSPLP